MRLSLFILHQKEPILQEWEDFARTMQPAASGMDVVALRDHASVILDTIIIQLGLVESEQEKFGKSRGQGSRGIQKLGTNPHAERILASFITACPAVTTCPASARTAVIMPGVSATSVV